MLTERRPDPGEKILLEDLKFIKSTLSTKIDNCKASNRPADMVAPTFNPKNGLKKLVKPNAKSVKVESFSNTSNNHYELSSFVEIFFIISVDVCFVIGFPV